MTELVALDIKLPITREEVADNDNINSLITKIEDLQNLQFSFDTIELIKEAKKLKTNANKFIKDFKVFCDPFEAEGKEIAKNRSRVKLTFEEIVNDKLQPILEREGNLKSLKDKLFVPSADIDSCKLKLENLKGFDGYEWFAYKDEALKIISQSKTFLENELLGFEKAAKEKLELEEKEKREREELIAKNAADNAKKEAEREFKLKQEADERDKKYQQDLDRKKAQDIEHRGKVHRKILEALRKLPCQSDGDFDVDMKFIVKAIVKGEIPHLFIKY